MLGTSDYSYKLIAGFFLISVAFAPANDFSQAVENALSGLGNELAYSGLDGWYFPREEFSYVNAGPFWGEHAGSASKAPSLDLADPLPAILNFHEQLREKGVDLILVPVPPKLLVYPDKVQSGLEARSLESTAAFYDALRKKGIQIVDLLPVFQEERIRQGKLLYCKTDSHFSGYGCVVTAREIVKAMQNQSTLTDSPGQPCQTRWDIVNVMGDLAPGHVSAEPVDLRFVGTAQDQSLRPLEPDPDSRILLLGDSHCLVFSVGDDMHTRGAGLPDQLACQLGQPVDLLGVRGSGSTPARLNLFRRTKRNPSYWDSKSVVIWCFAAREFTESPTGWRSLPITAE